MNLKNYKPLFNVLLVSLAILVANQLFLLLLKESIKNLVFHYSITQLNCFFCISSLLIVFVLILINQKNHDNVGYVFLLLTSIKMGISFYVMQPIINSNNLNNDFEKYNFFIVFAIYLTLETIVTIRILNRKQ